ncbi:acyl-CoA thioesterase II [Rothia sp. AR01]|uniref:Acyl-CoA thioesterase 2 n=1 Tax=Rothia santali TaxID=2949643 RepID=A0A9X2KI91_9MICC|nr:acyl-CoA thioesterase II [Rothia santali]MCP3425770.1 acyl-CoA thioesterase II [Rothia santali]
MLDLEPTEPLRTTEDIFVGRTVGPETRRVFGGQVLGQSVIAAARTVAEDRAVHSLHGYFLRPGDVTRPITFGVERMRDGGSFSARRVHAYQEGRVILSCIASFQSEDEGLEHQEPMPEGIPDPESLPSPADLWGHIDSPLAQRVVRGRPFDLRYVTEPIYLRASEDRSAENAVWFKTHSALPDDPRIHRAAIAYASDYTPMDPILRRHGRSWADIGMNMASLDHAIWWHREARADEWLLYVQTSPNASNTRGLACGRIFDAAGRLIASTAQEGLVRLPERSASGSGGAKG